MKRLTLLTACALSLCTSAHADDLRKLADTDLYQKIAHDCRTVPLETWRHPTRQVLLKNKVQLDGLELCNAGLYPIFHVTFRYDPGTANTNSFFTPLYVEMMRANGHHRFAFVDSGSHWISYISEVNGVVNEESDEYSP